MSPGQMMPGQMFMWQLESFLDVSRNLPLRCHKNRVSNSWDIPDMDKCRQDKCCLNKCHHDSWNLFVAWTNDTPTVGICSKCSQVPTFKVFIKIGSVTAEILLTLSFCGVGGVGWGVQSHYIVKPNLVLRLGWGFDNCLIMLPYF